MDFKRNSEGKNVKPTTTSEYLNKANSANLIYIKGSH